MLRTLKCGSIHRGSDFSRGTEANWVSCGSWKLTRESTGLDWSFLYHLAPRFDQQFDPLAETKLRGYHGAAGSLTRKSTGLDWSFLYHLMPRFDRQFDSMIKTNLRGAVWQLAVD